MFIGFLLTLLAGCESCFEEPPPADDALMTSLDGGWPHVVISQPASFRAFSEGAESQGWSDLFHGDLEAAEKNLTGVPHRRVLAEQALIAQDIERLAALAFELSYDAWLANDAIPPHSAVPLAAVLAAIDRGDTEDAQAWLDRIPTYSDTELDALAKNLTTTGLKPADQATPSIISDCIRAQLKARGAGDFNLLEPCGGKGNTVLFEGGKTSGHDTLHNPLLYATYARIAEARQKAAGMLEPSEAKEPGLAFLVFSMDWNLEDLGATLRGQPAPTLGKFGLVEIESRKDIADNARQWIAHLDGQLDQWNSSAVNKASEEGRQIAFDVMPVEIYRSGIYQHQARLALLRNSPNQAMVFLNAATNLEQPRQLGARNRVSLYVLRAEARLRNGRTREALDDMLIIADLYPHIHGLKETMNDLAIMQTSSRSGDSKEH